MVTTLVFGAGVSYPYGFPLGLKLIELIKDKLNPNNHLENMFLNDLKSLKPLSIDQFLKDKKTHDEIAKIKIAEILYEAEKIDQFEIPPEENFYQFLFHKIRPDIYSNYRVISFNYDRSFEFYFSRALEALHECTSNEAFETLRKLKIVHIHGRISGLPYEEQFNSHLLREQLEYGHMNTPRWAEVYNNLAGGDFQSYDRYYDKQKEMIGRYGKATFKTVYENSGENAEARKFLQESGRVFFLGFSYHDLNMKILGFDNPNTYSGKLVSGTCLGMGKIDVKSIQKKYPVISGLHDCTSGEFFKNYYSIDDPDLDIINN